MRGSGSRSSHAKPGATLEQKRVSYLGVSDNALDFNHTKISIGLRFIMWAARLVANDDASRNFLSDRTYSGFRIFLVLTEATQRCFGLFQVFMKVLLVIKSLGGTVYWGFYSCAFIRKFQDYLCYTERLRRLLVGPPHDRQHLQCLSCHCGIKRSNKYAVKPRASEELK